ncbi:ribonuclease h2 subunit c [Trichoderma arundinaceum]|uniref:Ribonuclease h2 subunit c n=1 Tax=Trichoderma arundinaceum TaxID=490622 RepID=A0A395ND01_TRIAR|nr:ribonuclease h2 subunit c [Trichoderma arundinaceum]
MSQPSMLEIRKDEATASEGVVNLLPCRVHHTGPIEPASAYWNPTAGEEETRTAYLRGRKLQGKTALLPTNYRGVVLQRKDDEQSTVEQPDVIVIGEDGEEGSAPPLGTMHTVTEFDKMVVWSHDTVADASSDPYLRGVEEWLQVADSAEEDKWSRGAAQGFEQMRNDWLHIERLDTV